MQKKKGISLIVLVITIIVMIILAAAIILSLNNAGIINKANQAVQETDLAQVKHLATLAWSEAYLEGNLRESSAIKGYIETKLTEAKVDLDKYELNVTEKGVDVFLKGEQPEQWVVATVDTVPIPKGFVASPYDGENTKNGGLVIYELTGNETEIPSTETQYTSLTTRNQYVWVPVEDFSKFIRQKFGEDDTTIMNMIELDYGLNYWEVELNTETNMPIIKQDANYMTATTLQEVQAMYESVKEYKGFYIARYEAGIDEARTEASTSENLPSGNSVYSRMNKIPYTYISAGSIASEETNGAVKVARSLYPTTNTNYGVVSTLTYGVQWDTVLQWWLDKNVITTVESSDSYGNYADSYIEAVNLNEGAKYAAFSMEESKLSEFHSITSFLQKNSYDTYLFSTGAVKFAKVNNIYDMAGNVHEHTMEVSVSKTGAGGYTSRGGSFENLGGWSSQFPVRRRGGSGSYSTGFRTCLYIKK